MNEAKHAYQSYLLRLWVVKEGEHSVWRASLEEVRSGNKKVFTTLEEMYQYLTLTVDTAVTDKKE